MTFAQRLTGLLAVIFALLGIGTMGCSQSPNHSPLPAGTPVLAFGNSVTFGTGASPQESYPVQLAALTGWKIHNAGIPGDTADLARTRIAENIAESKPRLVIIEIGGNDFLRQRPEQAVKEDIRAMIGEVRKANAIPVLVAVPRLSILAPFAILNDSPIYAELATEEKVLLVKDVFSGILSDNRLKTDPIHPNAAGYQKLAEGIAKTLTRSGLLSGR